MHGSVSKRKWKRRKKRTKSTISLLKVINNTSIWNCFLSPPPHSNLSSLGSCFLLLCYFLYYVLPHYCSLCKKCLEMKNKRTGDLSQIFDDDDDDDAMFGDIFLLFLVLLLSPHCISAGSLLFFFLDWDRTTTWLFFYHDALVPSRIASSLLISQAFLWLFISSLFGRFVETWIEEHTTWRETEEDQLDSPILLSSPWRYHWSP